MRRAACRSLQVKFAHASPVVFAFGPSFTSCLLRLFSALRGATRPRITSPGRVVSTDVTVLYGDASRAHEANFFLHPSTRATTTEAHKYTRIHSERNRRSHGRDRHPPSSSCLPVTLVPSTQTKVGSRNRYEKSKPAGTSARVEVVPKQLAVGLLLHSIGTIATDLTLFGLTRAMEETKGPNWQRGKTALTAASRPKMRSMPPPSPVSDGSSCSLESGVWRRGAVSLSSVGISLSEPLWTPLRAPTSPPTTHVVAARALLCHLSVTAVPTAAS